MFSAVARIFRTPDLRRKIGFTLGIVALFRLGSFIPAPFVKFENVQACLQASSGAAGSLYDLVNLFSGGALLQLSIFALGIMPYITASIIVQLLRVVIPHFETLHKEGQAGQGKLTQYTRYLTIALGVLQSTTLITVARSGALFPSGSIAECQDLIANDTWYAILLMVITMRGDWAEFNGWQNPMGQATEETLRAMGTISEAEYTAKRAQIIAEL